MHFEAHSGIGWLLANTYKGGDRRFRATVVLAAVIPDIDAVSYLFGPEAYLKYHHLSGHNLLFSLVVSAAATLVCRNARWPAFIMTQVAFYIHYFGDYFFTLYPLYYFWPFSRIHFLSDSAVHLAHPLNTLFLWLGLAALILPAFLIKRTPVEIFSPELDQRLVHLFFTRRNLKCFICGRKCNEQCSDCGQAVCSRHAVLTKGFKLRCSNCKTSEQVVV